MLPGNLSDPSPQLSLILSLLSFPGPAPDSPFRTLRRFPHVFICRRMRLGTRSVRRDVGLQICRWRSLRKLWGTGGRMGEGLVAPGVLQFRRPRDMALCYVT